MNVIISLSANYQAIIYDDGTCEKFDNLDELFIKSITEIFCGKGVNNMAIGKDKTMLQIPVDKRVAKTWNDLVKQLNIKQGDLFAVALAQFLQSCIKKANEEAKKGKTKNVKN